MCISANLGKLSSFLIFSHRHNGPENMCRRNMVISNERTPCITGFHKPLELLETIAQVPEKVKNRGILRLCKSLGNEEFFARWQFWLSTLRELGKIYFICFFCKFDEHKRSEYFFHSSSLVWNY